MPEHSTSLDIAPAYAETGRPVFTNREQLDDFWHEFASKVKQQLQVWDNARAQSEENARNLWLCRKPPE